MKDKDPLEDKTYADVVEDENNEWITGIVPGVVEIVAEPKGVDIEELTSKQKKVFCPRKIKSLPVYHDDELQSAGSSSELEDAPMHSPSSSFSLE
jgi:hypothetical protein